MITLLAPEQLLYGVNDCSVAAENMNLMAWSLGIGSCYVSRAEDTFKTVEGKALMTQVDIPNNYIARVCLCIGYPEGEIGASKPRRENRIFHIGS